MAESSSSLWSDLPPELLDSVFDCLCNLKDILRSSSVCSSWHYSASLVYHRKFVPSLFMFNDSANKESRILNLLRDPTHHEESVNLDFTADSEIWFCGCTRGFLLAMGVSFPYEVHLINPSTKAITSLPSLTPLEDVHLLLRFVKEASRASDILRNLVKKVVSSAVPSNPDCIVMIIYSVDRKLAFCRHGDKIWTGFDPVHGASSIDDIVFYKGMFLAIDRIGEIYRCELSRDAPKATPMGKAAPFKYEPCKKYFAASANGELFLVLKKLEYDDEGDPTTCFAIYELDSGTGEWGEVRSLKGKAVFLSSRGLSLAVLAGNARSGGGFVEDNSVYFTDGVGASDNVSVFEWESKQIKKLYQPSSWNSHLFWITPADAY